MVIEFIYLVVSKAKLIELVKPYFIEQFYYKLDIEKNKNI
jgi:hypothetical protein